MRDTLVQVTAPARLHLGFVDLNGDIGRRFGSIGLTVTGLDVIVTATPSTIVECIGHKASRVARYAESALGVLGETRGVALTVEHAPPIHVGLGSGTQLGLAVAVACARLYGYDASARCLAPAIGRGERSGIGIAAFEGGGFIVDGGRTANNSTAPLLSRLAFPAQWQALLVFDDEYRGLHGAAERNAFVELPPMSPAVAAEIARWCLVGLLPAIADADFPAFATSVSAIQTYIGRYFAPAQGGSPFTSPRVAQLIDLLGRHFGALGAGQSSWGPTGFAFAPDRQIAQDMRQIGERFAATNPGLRLQLVSGCNHGALIETCRLGAAG